MHNALGVAEVQCLSQSETILSKAQKGRILYQCQRATGKEIGSPGAQCTRRSVLGAWGYKTVAEGCRILDDVHELDDVRMLLRTQDLQDLNLSFDF